MLQVASGLSGYCICFTHMLQVYIPDISSVSNVRYIQVFNVAHVSCCSESQGRRRPDGWGRVKSRQMGRVAHAGRGELGDGASCTGVQMLAMPFFLNQTNLNLTKKSIYNYITK